MLSFQISSATGPWLFTTSIRGELGTETEVEISAGTGGEQGEIGVLLRNVSRRLPSGNESDFLRTALGSMSEQIGKSSLRNLVKNTVSIVEQHYVKQALEDVGVGINLTVPDRPSSIKRIYTDYDFDMAISNQANPSEPVPSTTQYYTSDGIKKGVPFRNANGYSNPEVIEELRALWKIKLYMDEVVKTKNLKREKSDIVQRRRK